MTKKYMTGDAGSHCPPLFNYVFSVRSLLRFSRPSKGWSAVSLFRSFTTLSLVSLGTNTTVARKQRRIESDCRIDHFTVVGESETGG